MVNPFSGIITPEMKLLFTNAIDALLEDDACTVPCRLIYGNTKFVDCVNCIFDPIGNKSSNRYQAGGPIPFRNGGICPVCHGIGKIPSEATTGNFRMIVIWDYKSWLPLNTPVQSPEGFAQTMSQMNTLPSLKRAKEAILNTDIENHVTHRFMRHGEPEPCGLGNDAYIITMWKRAG